MQIRELEAKSNKYSHHRETTFIGNVNKAVFYVANLQEAHTTVFYCDATILGFAYYDDHWPVHFLFFFLEKGY